MEAHKVRVVLFSLLYRIHFAPFPLMFAPLIKRWDLEKKLYWEGNTQVFQSMADKATLDPPVECRESRIHGIGVFAKRNIRVGDIVGYYPGTFSTTTNDPRN